MSKVTRYKQSNGRYSVVVENVDLTDDALLLLDNNYPLDVNFEVIDGKKITVQQRKKIFALLNDIYLFTGQPQEDLRQQFQFYLEMIKGYEPISLTDTTRRIASELIEVIIAWVFQHDIPLNYKTSDLMKEDNYFIYLSTINRTCVVCGKKNADLAHRYAVGRGRNRNTIDHYGNEVLALCRRHHQTQHDMGIQSFNAKVSPRRTAG
jgi:hypothetical protein